MCGICGIVSGDNNKVTEDNVIGMLDELIHRGPDDYGVYLKNSGKSSIILGQRRLSIIDLTTGHQPIFNEDRSLSIICNGEIYNFKELRVKLEKDGHKFQTNSDTEVIVHLYEKYEERCLSHLRGAFAFAVWDEKNSRLFLARDRVGKRPLLYALKKGKFIFASEFKALLAYPDVSKEINPEGIDAYLTYGYIPAPLTVYKDIYKLPPAHFLIFRNGQIEIKKYWILNFKDKIDLPEEPLRERVRELVTEAVRIRMISDVPLGAFLSGGIDSSIVVGLMSRISSDKIKTFSIGFSEKRYDELGYARIIAKKFNTEHKEFIVKPDIESILPFLIRHYGEPYADSSAIPSYYLTKMARSYVHVALNGDGGDELFAGYERHWANRIASSRMAQLFLKAGAGKAMAAIIPRGLNPKNFFMRLGRFARAASDSPPVRYQKWVGVFTDEQKNMLYTTEFSNISSAFSAMRWLEDAFKEAEGLDPVDTFLYIDTMLNLPNDFLVKMDIACMANSLEGRSPFLDQELMEFAASIPSALKLKGKFSKYILRKAFSDILPEEIYSRGKMGFAMPIGLWFRNQLSGYIRSVLLSNESLRRGYFKPELVKVMVEEHIAGSRDYTTQLWALLVLELWHRGFID